MRRARELRERQRKGSDDGTERVVIDRLRAFLNRPLPDTERRRLFVAAIAVILAGAGAFPTRRAAPPTTACDAHAPSVPPAAPPVVVLPAQDTPSPQAPSEEGAPRNRPRGLRRRRRVRQARGDGGS